MPVQRDLVIVGGGHAHVHVLKSFAMRPVAAARLTVITPASYAAYTGMVPGVLARQYQLSEAQIDVRGLAARAGATFLSDRVVRIEPRAQRLYLHERPPVAYDVLSLDVGSRPAAADRLAAGAPVTLVKPIEVAAEQIEAALSSAPPPAGRRVLVVGAGPGGVEVAFAVAARLRAEGRGSVTLCDTALQPASRRHPRTSARVAAVLAQHRIAFVGGVEVVRVDTSGVILHDGRRLPATLVVWATGAAGPSLLAASGLPVDDRGFLLVGDDLRCVAYPQILAAGDCATLASYPDLPKAGVYAVREGPILTHNLRAVAGESARLRRYRPQKGFLSLLNTGDGKAILSWGRYAGYGRLAWRLKDYIDRRFIRRYERPSLAAAHAMGRPMVACGGCAAKVGGDVLRRVLSRLRVPRSEGVLVGLDDADDAAVFAQPPGTLAVATVDAFPPFTDDLYVVGEVAATNAASDLYAMGAEGTAALALVCLPASDDPRSEERLEHFLRGALAQLTHLGIPLVGGHTIAGEQTLLGFAMHGCVEAGHVLRKRGARSGDRLVLSKPLGTGVVLAAARAGVAAADWVETALDSMRRSNQAVMHLLRAHGVHACTDVTGFGLAGHLREILRASSVGARLSAPSIPALPGALELLAAGWRSSFHATNTGAHRQSTATGEANLEALCFDPQTSGGLLAAVPADQLASLCRACEQAGEELHVIGEIVDGPVEWRLAEA